MAEGEDIIERLAESERKQSALILLLQDKCEDVLDLTAKVDQLEREVKTLRNQLESVEDTSELSSKLEAATARNEMLSKNIEEYEAVNRDNQVEIKELRRRLETLAQAMQDIIVNPMSVASIAPESETTSISSFFSWGEKGKRQQMQAQELRQLQAQIISNQFQLAAANEKLTNMETQMKMEALTRQTLERQLREAEEKYIREADQLRNARASIEAYESKLKAVEKGSKDNLEHQGRLHRRDKETLRKLNKKIEELQFLLDERDDDDDSSDSFDDSSSEEESDK